MTQIVEVETIEIRSGGILVKLLDDNRTGFIRRRELSWERRIGLRPEIPEVGQRFNAKIVHAGGDGRYPLLSLRQLTNPWENIRSRYAINGIVRGEVVNVRDFGVFVQVEPGVDAIIWPRNLPLLPDEYPRDILAVGDQVQGVLLNIDKSKQQMELSLTHLLVQVGQAISNGQFPQLAIFKDKLKESGVDVTFGSSTSPSPTGGILSGRYHPPLAKLERVLIVDDSPDDRKRIAHALKQESDYHFSGVSNGEKGLEKLAEEPAYDIIIIDLTLEDEDGIDVARRLLDKQPSLPILFTSNNPLVDEDKLVLYGRKYPFALKEREELAASINKLYSGYWEESDLASKMVVGKGDSFVRQLGLTLLARAKLSDVLSSLLSRLRKRTGVTHALILQLDIVKESVAIKAMDPQLDDELLYGTDALYFSPIREVAENNVPDYQKFIPSDRPSSLKNFFPLLDYQTFLGIPLTIPGMPTRHVLLVLDDYRPAMSDEVKEQVYLTAQFIQVALERAMLLDFMQRYEQRYTLGQLLGSLIHELSNQFDTLAGIDDLAIQLQRAERATEADEQVHWLQKGQETAVRLARAKQDLLELVLSYSRLASGSFEAVDVYKVVMKIVRQLGKKAKEMNIHLFVPKKPSLPPALAVQSRLEQVVTNVLLNALQQVEQQRRRMVDIAHGRDKIPLCQQGVVSIRIRYRKDVAYPLEIIVMDSGPGIATHRQEKIFLLDTSGREEGHGLGLYISRSLMETMGGRLSLADSVMFVGSAFVIALSEFPAEGVDDGQNKDFTY